MALATRCPHCQTAFKVANDQLKLHAGLVRCGSCQQTFNAVENLIPADAQKPPQPAATKPAATIAAPEPVAAKPPINVASSSASATTAITTAAAIVQTDTVPVPPRDQPVTRPAPDASIKPDAVDAKVANPAATPTAATLTNVATGTQATKAQSLPPVAPVKATPVPVVSVLPAEKVAPAVSAPVPTPAISVAAGKNAANGKAAAEVLAAISKAEKEFEAAHLDKPRTSTTASVARPIATTPEIVAANARLEPRLDTRPAKPAEVILPKADKKIEPKIETASSATALDFDLGEGGFLLPSEEVHETDLARAELETRAALMDPPTADWSVSEVQDEPEGKAALGATPSTETPEVHDAGSKVWRHKDHGDAPALDQADSITERAAEELVKASVEQEEHKEPYIGVEEAALASRAAANEDSSSDAEEDQHKPNFVIQAEKQRARKRISTVMLSLSVVLLLPLLLAQSAYILRNQLAARMPETKPYLLQACKFLQCQVALPAQIEKIIIDSNELQNLAPERNVFMLVMQLQNQSDVVQTWPQVELVLNDVKEKPLLQRTFKPEDYLTDKDKLAKGFAAGGEQNIKLYFELPTVKAAGFKVALFYP